MSYLRSKKVLLKRGVVGYRGSLKDGQGLDRQAESRASPARKSD